jgi:hypothetical protein
MLPGRAHGTLMAQNFRQDGAQRRGGISTGHPRTPREVCYKAGIGKAGICARALLGQRRRALPRQKT